jgi:hypothetical protein
VAECLICLSSGGYRMRCVRRQMDEMPESLLEIRLLPHALRAQEDGQNA